MKRGCGRCKYFDRIYKKNICKNEAIYTQLEHLTFYTKACRNFEWIERLKGLHKEKI